MKDVLISFVLKGILLLKFDEFWYEHETEPVILCQASDALKIKSLDVSIECTFLHNRDKQHAIYPVPIPNFMIFTSTFKSKDCKILFEVFYGKV